jgi:hypothetical protein
MRIFKTKSLAKFAKQNDIKDESLVEAIDRAVKGLIDADLGGQLIKQRVARPGQGKRGGFRMLIGIRPDRAVFLFGFAKNERENIDNDQLKTLREIAMSWFVADNARIAKALKDGILIEVQDDSKSKKGADEKGQRSAH